jgi:hypothetical protein
LSPTGQAPLQITSISFSFLSLFLADAKCHLSFNPCNELPTTHRPFVFHLFLFFGGLQVPKPAGLPWLQKREFFLHVLMKIEGKYFIAPRLGRYQVSY